MIVLVALAGGLGAAARFVVDGEVRRRWSTDFPWATLTINVTGSFLLGVAAGLSVFHGSPDDLRLVVGVGFCGGYTTFSTATLETLRLAQQGQPTRAVANAALPLVLSVLVAGAGLALAAAA